MHILAEQVSKDSLHKYVYLNICREDSVGRSVCFAVICVQFRSDEYISESRSATHSLPPGIERLMAEGDELGVATDRFFSDDLPSGCTQFHWLATLQQAAGIRV